MKDVVVLIGSLRKDSYNRALFEACKKHAPEGMALREVPIMLPLFNEDAEADFPQEATAFKEELERADGILIISPEYNRSIPGGLKNAIDWVSRTGGTGQASFKGKKIAVAGATPGSIGTAVMQHHLRSVLLHLGAEVMGIPEFHFGKARDRVDVDGTLKEEKDVAFVQKFLSAFGDFLERE
ncbi:MAG: NADPH-dependent FMN reductase [Patescibacteria group bacterium UBA2163]